MVKVVRCHEWFILHVHCTWENLGLIVDTHGRYKCTVDYLISKPRITISFMYYVAGTTVNAYSARHLHVFFEHCTSATYTMAMMPCERFICDATPLDRLCTMRSLLSRWDNAVWVAKPTCLRRRRRAPLRTCMLAIGCTWRCV